MFILQSQTEDWRLKSAVYCFWRANNIFSKQQTNKKDKVSVQASVNEAEACKAMYVLMFIGWMLRFCKKIISLKFGSSFFFLVDIIKIKWSIVMKKCSNLYKKFHNIYKT